MNINVEIRKWGNSLGIIIPKQIAEKLNFNAGDHITLDIQGRQNTLREMFGTVRFKEPTKKILSEVRGELEGRLV